MTTVPRADRRALAGEEGELRAQVEEVARLEELIARYPLRGIKGPVGTSQDMLDLLNGDQAKLADLERRIADHLGFAAVFTSTGQIYPRSLDYDVVTALAQAAAAPSNAISRLPVPEASMPAVGICPDGSTAGMIVSARLTL